MTERREHEAFVLAAGPHVRIRLRRKSDAADEYRWRADPETARYNGRAAVTEPFQKFLDLVAYELSYGVNDREQFAIETNDGRHIGTIMLYNFGRGGESAELGVTIGDDDNRGAGLGREAVTVFLRWIWNNRPLRVVYLHVLEWNERAARCFSRSGFDPVARVLRDGQAFTRMESRREWWLLWDAEGRFQFERETANEGTEGSVANSGMAAIPER